MKTTIASIVIRAAAGALAFALLGAPSCGHILEDEGFDLWCGDRLCNWELEEGEIARIATWHEGDPGVELVGPSAAISQLATIDQGGHGCFRFEAVADVDELAVVTLELDFYDDGVIDHEERIPTSSWEPVSFLITPPQVFHAVRFRVRKLGNGQAALAQIEVTDDDKCVEPPIDLAPRELGMGCTADAQCASGQCYGAIDPQIFASVCSGCETSVDCAAGQACGMESMVPRWYSPYPACVDEASQPVGVRCLDDAGCIAGHCTDGLCSACGAATDCGDGESCAAVTGGGYDLLPSRPYLCSAGGLVASGGFCLVDDQCAGASCTGSGELKVCLADGRLCDADADCPVDITDLESRDGHCVVLGVRDGRCD